LKSKLITMKYNQKTLTFILSLTLMPLFSQAEPLTAGATAPAFTVTVETGETLELAALYAKGPVLVYFYPKADTPGCTKQACNLRDHFADLEKAGIQVLGASLDSVKSQAAFKKKYELPFPLVADTDKALAKAFGVPTNMGLFTARQSFLVVDGKVVWSDTSATPATQAADALAALAAHRS
jgi:thioredoxin-dependent peroxiredoxin